MALYRRPGLHVAASFQAARRVRMRAPSSTYCCTMHLWPLRAARATVSHPLSSTGLFWLRRKPADRGPWGAFLHHSYLHIPPPTHTHHFCTLEPVRTVPPDRSHWPARLSSSGRCRRPIPEVSHTPPRAIVVTRRLKPPMYPVDDVPGSLKPRPGESARRHAARPAPSLALWSGSRPGPAPSSFRRLCCCCHFPRFIRA